MWRWSSSLCYCILWLLHQEFVSSTLIQQQYLCQPCTKYKGPGNNAAVEGGKDGHMATPMIIKLKSYCSGILKIDKAGHFNVSLSKGEWGMGLGLGPSSHVYQEAWIPRGKSDHFFQMTIDKGVSQQTWQNRTTKQTIKFNSSTKYIYLINTHHNRPKNDDFRRTLVSSREACTG